MIALIVILLFSVIVHEYMHGWAAFRLGDPTAKNAGRLTLNPIPHLDLVGSILLPAILILSKAGIILGYAKPVPVDFNNLNDKKYGMAKVAAAGPLGNLILALSAGLILRLLPASSLLSNSPSLITACLVMVVKLNILLMLFNLIPVPPLDGSKILMTFLPHNWQIKMMKLERFGIFLVLLLFVLGFPIIWIFNFSSLLSKLIIGI